MSQKRNCSKCNEEFLVIDQEEKFYQEKDLPLPEMCPKHRRERRISDRHERELYGYNCDNCKKSIVVAFNPPADWTIYCKDCYQKYYSTNDCILGYSEGAKSLNPEAKSE
jgi:CxxC-x17-CxxC domain-containing protein